MPKLDAVITVYDIEFFLQLLKDYCNAGLPSAAVSDVRMLLNGFQPALGSKGTQDETDALYVEAIKNVLLHYAVFETHMKNTTDQNERAVLEKMLEKLNGYVKKFEKYIDKGIYHDYFPSMAEALALQGSRFTVASGPTEMLLEIKKVWHAPKEVPDETPSEPASPAPGGQADPPIVKCC